MLRQPRCATTRVLRWLMSPSVVAIPWPIMWPIVGQLAHDPRRSCARAVTSEGINRREVVNSFPLRPFPSSSFPSLICAHRAHRRRLAPLARHCRTPPPPDSAHASCPVHRRRTTRRTSWTRTLPPHAVATVPHRRGKFPLSPCSSLLSVGSRRWPFFRRTNVSLFSSFSATVNFSHRR